MKRLKSGALVLALSFTCSVLTASTFFLQSLGGAGGPALPYDPDDGTKPLTEIGPDEYVVDDGTSGTSSASSPMRARSMVSADSINPNSGGTTIESDSQQPAPVRNYTKYGAQVFSVVDTNAVLQYNLDTNLFEACADMPADTNTIPWLVIVPYGPDAYLVRADNFDYSYTNADFALLVCDKVGDPIWKSVDLGGASDAQDGWLIQGSVPYWQVTSPMYMLVTNINRSYNAFFCAIPYMGPQVTITGTNQPYDTVSNTITLTAQVMDLSGTTNEQFQVTVDGDTARYTLGNNAITVNTAYNANDIHDIYLNVSGQQTVYNVTSTNVFPDVQKVFYDGSTYIPLYFANDTYLIYSGDNASQTIGTNFFLYGISKPQNVAQIITDPNNNVIQAVTNYIPSAGTVSFPWNFTEADGVTPYSNDTYIVQFIAFDPSTLLYTNTTDKHGVRTAAANINTYEQEDPSLSDGPYLNSWAAHYDDQTLEPLYESLYSFDPFSEPQYLLSAIGAGRDNPPNTFPFILNPSTVPGWGWAVATSCSNLNYSDFNYYMGHGNTFFIGGGPAGTTWVSNTLDSFDVESWATMAPAQPNWRMRKVTIWSCYSYGPGFHQYASADPNWPEAFGIRDTSQQTTYAETKNVFLGFHDQLPQGGYSGTYSHTSVEVAVDFDQLWILGPNQYPGGCDPTYAFAWCLNVINGMNPELQPAGPAWIGFGYLPYTGIYDSQIVTNNVYGIKNP